MARRIDAAARILDTALDLADERSWEAVRLFDVAHAAGLSLDDIRRHYREKEDLVDAWFDRADQALLQAGTDPALAALPAAARIEHLLMIWLNALRPHHRVTRQMILGRLEPGHLHVQIPALLRISRTVQWLREAARCDATYLRRALEETALTAVYVTTFGYWLRDDSHESRSTRSLLRRLLAGWERCTQPVGRGSVQPGDTGVQSTAEPATPP